MTLETKRLLLRPWREADAPILFTYARDPRVGPAAGWPVHTSVENSREVIRGLLSGPENYAVVLKERGEPVGSIGIIRPPRVREPGKNEAELGYWIAVPFWGRGLIPEAVREMLRRCFAELGCEAVWCGYYDGNEKSRRVQEKCGFRYDHTEENQLCELLGETRTEHFTRLTRADWLSRQEKETE